MLSSFIEYAIAETIVLCFCIFADLLQILGSTMNREAFSSVLCFAVSLAISSTNIVH